LAEMQQKVKDKGHKGMSSELQQAADEFMSRLNEPSSAAGNHEGKFLNGYASDCGKQHASFVAAVQACLADPQAAGITQEESGCYTVRMGTELLPSPSGESSWLKQDLLRQQPASVLASPTSSGAGFVVDTGIIVQKVMKQVKKLVKKTAAGVEKKIDQLKRELPDSEPDRELVLPAMSFLPEGCVRKWEKGSSFSLTMIAALYTIILAATCTCLISRSWWECDVGTSTIDFGLDWGLFHSENKIVDYSGDTEKMANTAISFLILAVIALLPGLGMTAIPVMGLKFTNYRLHHLGKHIFRLCNKDYDFNLRLDAITPDRFFLIGTVTNTLFVVFAAVGLSTASKLDFSGCNADPGAALYIMWVVWLVSVKLMFTWVLPFSSRGSVALWPTPKDTEDTQESDTEQSDTDQVAEPGWFSPSKIDEGAEVSELALAVGVAPVAPLTDVVVKDEEDEQDDSIPSPQI